MTRSVLLLACVVALTLATRSFHPGDADVTGTGATLALGFVLLAAFYMGRLFHAIGLPHLTGYLLCGVVFGPGVAGILSTPMLEDLALVKRVAVGLIALLAGCELNLHALRPRIGRILTVGGAAVVCAVVFLFVFFYCAIPYVAATAAITGFPRVVLALMGANVLAALSPAVIMGILTETRAAGPLSETSLSIVVIADMFIVVTYALTGSLVGHAFPVPGGAAESVLRELSLHFGGSMAAGGVLAAVVTVYARRVGDRLGVFVFGLLFLVAEAGHSLHLDPLLTGLTAGLLIENASPLDGAAVVRRTEAATLPTFALFFTVIGAEVHLDTFARVALLAAIGAAARAAGLYGGARIGARLVGVDEALARRIPFGLFPQAGIALALANLVITGPYAWSREIGTLILGTIVINEMIGPVLFRIALQRAGEVGVRERWGTVTAAEDTA